MTPLKSSELVRSSSVLLGISLGYAAAAVGAVARQATPGCEENEYTRVLWDLNRNSPEKIYIYIYRGCMFFLDYLYS